MSEFIEEFHIVEIQGNAGAVFVTELVRLEIEAAMRNDDKLIWIDDMYGAEHTLVVDRICTIHTSTPAIRESYSSHNKGIDAEGMARGDFSGN